MIAQELETVVSQCVTTETTGLKAVDTDELFWMMLNSVKELSVKVTALETENTALKARVTTLEG